jgi:hypothetical protein
MPLGMVWSTFNRMMRLLLSWINDTDNYIDDVVGHNVTCKRYLKMLRYMSEEIREAKIKVNMIYNI